MDRGEVSERLASRPERDETTRPCHAISKGLKSISNAPLKRWQRNKIDMDAAGGD